MTSTTYSFFTGACILPKRRLGINGPEIPAVGLGCMGMSEFYGAADKKECQATLEEAIRNGCLLDTADVYGFGANEELVGAALKGRMRQDYFIATKCGIERSKTDTKKRAINNDPKYIIECCEASLKRLGIEYVDLYYLHRIANEGKDIEQSMVAMAELLKQNKIKAVGLSEANAETIQRAHEALLKYTDGQHGLSAIQTEYSLMSRAPEIDGTLAICKKFGIAFVPYSPLGRKLLTADVKSDTKFAEGDFRNDLPRFKQENIQLNLKIVNEIATMAKEKGCTPGQLSLAWILAQYEMIIPIPGTTHVKHLCENLAATSVKLTKADMERLNVIAPIGAFQGDRYSAPAMQAYGFKSEREIIAKTTAKVNATTITQTSVDSSSATTSGNATVSVSTSQLRQ